MGKTSIVLEVLRQLKASSGQKIKVLVIAPLRVCYVVWPEEVKKWKQFTGLKVEVLHGKDKADAIERDADIYVINPEGLEWLTGAKKVPTFKIVNGQRVPGRPRIEIDQVAWRRHGFNILVADELSKFKSHDSLRYKIMKLVIHTFSRRWGLTGSPVSNGLMDLFAQMFLIDQGRTFGPYITQFRRDFFVPLDNMGWTWALQHDGAERIYARMKPVALRMAAKDYLDLPQLIEHKIMVDLPEKARKAYDAMEEDLLARIADKTVVAGNAAAASGKCRQIANGGIYLTPEVIVQLKRPKVEREWLDLHEEKLDAVEDLIDELQGAPLLVVYDFEHDLDRLKKRFGKDVSVIGGKGGSKASATKALIDKWNRGEITAMFVHPQSVAHGLDGLQYVGHHVAWHSLTWNRELYDQLIGRLLRQGSKHKHVFSYLIMARNTIDDVILAALKSKDREQQALFDALKARVPARKVTK